MRRLIICCSLLPLLSVSRAPAQGVLGCRHAEISFFSSAPVEDIRARTDSAVSVINLKTGAVSFKVPISSFRFRYPLMQEHFNEKFLESARYPFASFAGKLEDFVLPDTAGIYPVTVAGTLTVHGVSRCYRVGGVLERKDGQLGADAVFDIRLSDHGIRIPRLLVKNIAEVVSVRVNVLYDIPGASDAQGPAMTAGMRSAAQPFQISLIGAALAEPAGGSWYIFSRVRSTL